MAITPRTVFRNPLLLLFFSTLTICAFALVFQCPTQSRCGMSKTQTPPPMARTAAVHTVNAATVQAARSAASGWLGVEIQTLTPERAKWAGVNASSGVLVLGVQDSRPADAAGFQAYDVVVRFAGKPMNSACQLKKTVASTAPGTKVPVEVVREGKRLMLHPTLTDKDGATGCGGACK